MKKIIPVLLILCLMMVIVSCEEEDEPVSVCLMIQEIPDNAVDGEFVFKCTENDYNDVTWRFVEGRDMYTGTLFPGNWSIEAKIYNASGETIATGSGGITVEKQSEGPGLLFTSVTLHAVN